MAKTRNRAAGKVVGQRLIESMREVAEALDSGRPLEERLTVRTVEINEPGEYDGGRIRRLRLRVGVSQAVFARMLGVSTVLLQHWEQGVSTPRPLARRLLDEVTRDPALFASRALRRTRASA